MPVPSLHRGLGRAGLVIAGGFVALTGCGGDDDPEGYGPEVRREFVDQCTAAGTARDVCGCFYDSLAAEIPFDRYERLDERIREGGDVPDDLADLAAACAAEQGQPG